MTPTDDMVSSRPQAGAAGSHDDRDRVRRRRGKRGLVTLGVALALVVPAPALAQTTGTSGYNQKPPAPKTTPEPKSGTAPSKEATTPSKEAPKEEVAPSTTPEPTSTTPAKATASKLPFTGLDLRWVIGAGALLLAGGLSLRVLQRRSAGR